MFREEAFSLLMIKAWELLLKAKWLADHDEDVETLYEMTKDKSGDRKPKENRSGNACDEHGNQLVPIVDVLSPT